MTNREPWRVSTKNGLDSGPVLGKKKKMRSLCYGSSIASLFWLF